MMNRRSESDKYSSYYAIADSLRYFDAINGPFIARSTRSTGASLTTL